MPRASRPSSTPFTVERARHRQPGRRGDWRTALVPRSQPKSMRSSVREPRLLRSPRTKSASPLRFLLDNFWQPVGVVSGTRPGMASEHPSGVAGCTTRTTRPKLPPHGPFGPLTRVQAAQNQWVTMEHAHRNHTRRPSAPAAFRRLRPARDRRTCTAALVPRRSPGRGRRPRRPHRRALRPHSRRHLGAAEPHPTVRREKRLGRLHVVRRVAGLAHRALPASTYGWRAPSPTCRS